MLTGNLTATHEFEVGSLFFKGFLVMPRINKNATADVPSKPNAAGRRGGDSSFTSDLQSIRCNLTSEDKKYVKANLPTSAEAIQFLCAVVTEGLKFTIGYDKNGEHCHVTLTDLRPDSATCKHTLQGRAKDVETALGVIMYKHVHLLRGDWSSAGAVVGDDDIQ